jgi:uncharacterized protein (DUF433 family)
MPVKAKRDPRIPTMKKLLEAGATLDEVGEQFGISYERVRQIMTGKFSKHKQQTARRQALAEFIRLYKDDVIAASMKGMSVPEIATDFGLPELHVYNLLRSERRKPEFRLERVRQLSAKYGKRYSDDDLLNAIKFVGEITGRTPSIVAYSKVREQHPELPSTALFLKRMSSWNEAVRRAGFEPNKRNEWAGFGARHFSDDDMIAAIRAVRDKLGYLPSINEYNEHRTADAPSGQTLRLRFGNWLTILQLAVNDNSNHNTKEH